MNFDDAITAHSQWKLRLLNVINGTSTETLDPQVVGADDKCVLGKWIYGEAKQYSHLPEYMALVQEHANLHKCASGVLRLVSAGEIENARSRIDRDGPFIDASIRTINAIRSLRRKVEPA
jgi:hypothetical protein